jgi:hypothetical protein
MNKSFLSFFSWDTRTLIRGLRRRGKVFDGFGYGEGVSDYAALLGAGRGHLVKWP